MKAIQPDVGVLEVVSEGIMYIAKAQLKLLCQLVLQLADVISV
jgi:hypothetical protein